MAEIHWTTYLTALLTPTIAVLGAFIAYWQWLTAQNKLKLDLFDRRIAIYDAARTLIASVKTNGKANDEELRTLESGIRSARWLLDEDIETYFENELRRKAVELLTLDNELQGLPAGDQRDKNVRKQSELRSGILDQYNVLDRNFEKYLRLNH